MLKAVSGLPYGKDRIYCRKRPVLGDAHFAPRDSRDSCDPCDPCGSWGPTLAILNTHNPKTYNF